MFLKPNQMYLESQGLYQEVCRLAQVRVQMKALQIEADQLEKHICDAMCPATEIVDLVFLRMQKGVSEAQLAEMFVARKEADGTLTVHPAYVSERFRPGGTQPDIPLIDARQMELFTENEEERERVLPPAPLSPKEKVEEREVVVEREKDDEEKKKVTESSSISESSSMESSSSDEDINIEGFIRFFNGLMKDASIPKIATLQGERLKALRARCREYGKGTIIEVLQKAAATPFLNGAGDKGWVASIDWLLRPNNFTKVLEGAYFQFRSKKPGMSPEQRQANRAIEEQRHEELWRSIEERERKCVTYEEYQRQMAEGKIEN